MLAPHPRSRPRRGPQLELADHIGDTRIPLAQLASVVGFKDTEPLFRLLRALESWGYFTEVRGAWANTPLSHVLRKDHPNCVSSMVGHLVDEGYGPWGKLLASLKENRPVFADAWNGKGIWELYKAEPVREARFSKAMSAVDHLTAEATLQDYPWRRSKVRFVRGRHADSDLTTATKHLLNPNPPLPSFRSPALDRRGRVPGIDARPHP